MNTHQSLNSDMGCGNGGSSISDLCVAWGLNVKHPTFLALCIRCTPILSVKICVKKCILYIGLHTGTQVPIGTEIHFEKYWYFTDSLRTGTKRHHFVFEYRFVLTN